MRKLRSMITILFIAAAVVCGLYIVKDKLSGRSDAPVITAEKDLITVSVKDKEKVLLKGLAAKDKEDGDLTEDIRVVSMSHFIKGSKRKVKYVVFDSSNQAGVYEREVQYKDYTSPRIYMKKALRYDVKEVTDVNLTDNMIAKDCLEGDLTNQIRCIFDEYVTTIERGDKRSLTVQVSNKAGDVCAIPVEVKIVDQTDADERDKYYPILSDYIVYTKAGKKLNLRKYITGLEQNGTEYLYSEDRELAARTKSKIKVTGDVDYSKPGVYTLDYSYRSEGGSKAITKMYVVVEEK